MSARVLTLALSTFTLLSLSGSAAAQPTGGGPADVTKDQAGYMYDFRDADKLTGATGGATGAVIHLRSSVMRRTLIRPRAHFVPELLKSVEHI